MMLQVGPVTKDEII